MVRVWSIRRSSHQGDRFWKERIRSQNRQSAASSVVSKRTSDRRIVDTPPCMHVWIGWEEVIPESSILQESRSVWTVGHVRGTSPSSVGTAESLTTAQDPEKSCGRFATGTNYELLTDDIIRWAALWRNSWIQQWRATASYQYALSTRTDCVVHALQSMCETDPQYTVPSIHEMSAFDLIARHVMMQGLRRLLWTSNWCLHSSVTGPNQIVQLLPERGDARRELIWNGSIPGRGLDSWCWLVRSLDVGRKRPVVSLGC